MAAKPKPEEALLENGLIHDILDFWFGAPGADGEFSPREIWWKPDPAHDAECAERFGGACARAASGDLDTWMRTAEGCLALVLLLDQFPHNIHRGTAGAFACDAKARSVAGHALDREFDADLATAQRLFLYLPFEHSEDIADQDRAVALISALGSDQWADYAERHRVIIARFGRFPHCNAILGRTSTDEEIAFLAEPDSSF